MRIQIRPRTLIVVLWAFGGSLLCAGDSPAERETLRGLKDIGVLIGLDLRIQDAGITATMLRPDIEAKLKRANIRVVPRTELLQKNMQDPTLIVNFSGTTKLGDAFSYRMELLVRQRVSPKSDQTTTWSIDRAGSVCVGEAAKIRGVVNTAINDFLKAYRSVNP
jgi:hypothetical protein